MLNSDKKLSHRPQTELTMLIDEASAEVWLSYLKAKRMIKKSGCDSSDLGNELGIFMARQYGPEEVECFISGLQHGKSLVDGTH